jgi:hypothetical protein
MTCLAARWSSACAVTLPCDNLALQTEHISKRVDTVPGELVVGLLFNGYTVVLREDSLSCSGS